MISVIGRRTDLWRIGIVHAAFAEIAAAHGVGDRPVTWLAEPGDLRFDADPFGLWHDGRLHLFVEAYDYRDRRGRIDALVLDADFAVIERRAALVEPWHLSYPQVFEADGDIYMLPEAHRSGGLTLYRARRFPWCWEPAARIVLDVVPVDATPLFADGRWWLFYAPARPRAAAQRALHVAFADHPRGPWTPHPGNPVHRSQASARPGGTAMVLADGIVLPVQDCRRGYGAAARLLAIRALGPDRFVAEPGPPLIPPASAGAYSDGFHTLSACGDVTLIDVKRIRRSLRRRGHDLGRLIAAAGSLSPARAR